MAFWSSQKLEAHLKRLTDHPEPKMIDCNALTLRVGPEYYVTPGLENPSPGTHTKQSLDIGKGMTIPPGQFAFLLTEEKITIPPEVMGFISVKATYKLKGLVNVSGFHVDPGWSGRLIFTVFNAGPSTIHLERKLPVFLLWIADLDEASERRKSGTGHDGIPPAIIGNITGVVDSIYALEKRVGENIAKVADKQEAFRKEVAELKERQTKILLGFAIAAVLGGAVVGAGVKMLGDHLFPATAPAAAAPLAGTGGQANGQAGEASANGAAAANGQPPEAGANTAAPDISPSGNGSAADGKGGAGE